MSNVTPIRPSSNSVASAQRKPPHLPLFVRKAVEEQQRRVWALRSLIECYRESIEAGTCSDVLGAGAGLLDLADSIHLALDEQAVAEKAEELKAEELKAEGKRRKRRFRLTEEQL